MKIYTKAVYNIVDSKKIESRSFQYSGPMSECKGGGGSSAPPPPTENELHIQDLQIAQLEREEEQARIMEPLLYESMGYKRVPGARGLELDAEIIGLQSQIRDLQGGVDISAEEVADANSLYNRNMPQISSIQKNISVLEEQRSSIDSTKDYSLEKIPEEKDEITRLLEERQMAALTGTLDVSPALEYNIEAKEEGLREQLARRLGAGYEHTTAGIQSLSEFDTYASLTREEARRGQIAMGESLLATRSGVELSQEQLDYNRMASFGAAPGSGDYLSALQPFQEQRQAEFQGAMADKARKAQVESGRMQAGVGVASAVGMIALAI